MRERDGSGIDGVGPVTDVNGSFADEAQPARTTTSVHHSQRLTGRWGVVFRNID
jgi:hypothetical protein